MIEKSLFGRAFAKTRREMLVSVLLLLAITLFLSLAMFFAERGRNPAFDVWDALVWIVVKYVEDPANVVNPPLTSIGKVLGTLVGFMSVAIVAIPAGLFGSGFIDAMRDADREAELEDSHHRLRKAFKPIFDATFRQYYEDHKSEISHDFSGVKFVQSVQPIVNLQSEKGFDIKDIIDTCRKYSNEFRLVNLAKCDAMENQPTDRLSVAYFPSNRIYGCCINRNSKVTIVCPTANNEIGVGYFTYNLAKFGGFNYISKEIDADPDERDSFFNMTNKLIYDGETYSLDDVLKMRKKDKRKEILIRKNDFRKRFLDDLKQLVNEDQSWTIVLAMHIKNRSNPTDFHFGHALKDGSCSTLNEDKIQSYESFYKEFADIMKEEYGLVSSESNSIRYRLEPRNIAYRIHEFNPNNNVFVLRPSIQLMNLNSNKLLLAYRMACVISKAFDGDKGILEKDLEDLKSGRFGFTV